MEPCCQGLNSSCKCPAAPCHATLLPRWLWDVPAALRRSAHEESVMEWLSETPGSIPHHTATPPFPIPGPYAQIGKGCLCSLVGQLTDGRQHRWWCLQQGLGGPGESTCHAWPGMPLISPRRSSHWPSADDQQESGELCPAQPWRSEMFFLSHMGIFDKWVVSHFQSPANPRGKVLGKTSAFKVIVIVFEHLVLIYYACCSARGQQTLTLAVC